jgi:hypothetical protein
MNTIYVDPTDSDKARRERLYDGHLVAYSPRSSTKALCEQARAMVEAAFDEHNPLTAQYSLPAEEHAAIVASLTDRWSSQTRSRELVRDVLEDLDCDLDKTYLGSPCLHVVASKGKPLSEEAIMPYRDTWQAAPMCQLNWWIPVYDIEAEAAPVFYPQYWKQAVPNGSHRFNYYDRNTRGREVAGQVGPEEPLEMEPQIRVMTSAGGLIVFSAAHMHSAVLNTSGMMRYSIAFRTVHIDDVLTKWGAENADSRATGTSLRDFMRCRDWRHVPEDVAQLYDSTPVLEGQEFRTTQT